MRHITRRQFGAAGTAMALYAGPAIAQAARNTVQLPPGGSAPALGQGSGGLAQGRHPATEEEEALRTGLSIGLTLLDTAEVYGNGRAEEMIGRVIAGRRETVFLVSKVWPAHASPEGIRAACAASLTRLGTDYLDLYLLHWREGIRDLLPVVETFEALKGESRIRRWGVSNFRVSDMEELLRLPAGGACATNQVPYNLHTRAGERDLIPWCRRQGLPIMAYSPLGSGSDLLQRPALTRVAERHRVAPAAVALAWTMRDAHTISIPESGSAAHVRENAAALTVRLTEQDLDELDKAFPV